VGVTSVMATTNSTQSVKHRVQLSTAKIGHMGRGK
jgi:hypothetical protein